MSFYFVGLEMISSGDVLVYGKNPTKGTSDVYRILPVDDLGDDYMFASHGRSGNFTSHIGIISMHSNTEVIISVPKLERGVKLQFGKHTVQEGQQHKIGLNAFETVQIESIQDLTGVRILSNHPVVVMVGETSKLKSVDGRTVLEHFESQLHPTKHWQNSYVAFPHSTSDFDDVFHIIGKSNI